MSMSHLRSKDVDTANDIVVKKNSCMSSSHTCHLLFNHASTKRNLHVNYHNPKQNNFRGIDVSPFIVIFRVIVEIIHTTFIATFNYLLGKLQTKVRGNYQLPPMTNLVPSTSLFQRKRSQTMWAMGSWVLNNNVIP